MIVLRAKSLLLSQENEERLYERLEERIQDGIGRGVIVVDALVDVFVDSGETKGTVVVSREKYPPTVRVENLIKANRKPLMHEIRRTRA